MFIITKMIMIFLKTKIFKKIMKIFITMSMLVMIINYLILFIKKMKLKRFLICFLVIPRLMARQSKVSPDL